jgi:hypothetical protein
VFALSAYTLIPPQQFRAGEVVGAGAGWLSRVDHQWSYRFGGGNLLGPDPILGFRTGTNGLYRYGWIELGQRTLPIPYNETYQPLRWAYETELNTPITVPITVIPEPASLISLLLCLLVAISLAVMRPSVFRRVRFYCWRFLGMLAVMLVLTSLAGAATVTLSQAQLLEADEVTTEFGGNGHVVSRVAEDVGVLFEIEGGTIDFGKVALRVLTNGADLTRFSEFGLRIEVVSAPNPVEVNPFILTGSIGSIFHEDEPGVKMEGELFDSFVPLAGVPDTDHTFALGFQYFTAGDVIEPPAQTVLLRVSPIPGASIVPEPATVLLLTLGVAALCIRRRRTT